jgi:hypothetical protein
LNKIVVHTERDRIELRAEGYSRHFKARGRTYVFPGRERRIEVLNRFHRRVVAGPEPRNPLWYLEDLVAWQRREPLEERFRTLVTSWKKEIAFESSLTEILMNHHYLKIIGLGPPALPLILEELQREPDRWFLALESITGEDPAASAENTGDFKKISEIWLEWGRDRGLI